MDLPQLRDLLVTYFSDNELRNLCFDLGIDYENLGGDGKSGKARELVAYCQRRDRLPDLEIACRRLRPNAFKDSPAASAGSATLPKAQGQPAGTVINQSGGVTINAQTVNITGDITGRDKKVEEGGTSSTSSAPPPPPSDLQTAPPQSQGEFKYDVFISYSHKDETWVTEKLLPALEKAGLRVCIDFRDFEAGKPSLINMQDAARNSRHTLLILTPNWVKSEWTLYEVLLTRTSDPAGMQRRTIPLRLQPCELPEFISMLTWVDFTRPDRYEVAWKQLLTALGAKPIQETPMPEAPATWNLVHPYGMPPNFTGRLDERALLTQWLTDDTSHPLLVIRALGGFGKSALAWHWMLNDVDKAQWPRAVWWSFYEGDANFEHFLSDTLKYLKIEPQGLGPRQQADALLQVLQHPGTLLILDGFERQLRAFSSMNAAYLGDDAPSPATESRGTPRRGQVAREGADRDCISPIAEFFLRSLASLPNLHSKVLMTTRLCPRILQAHGGQLLQGCLEKELTQMQPADAVTFFRAQGVRGSRTEIEAASEPYGYHPLSLRLLAGLILGDLQQPGDIAVAKRLDVSGDLIQRQHHVLQQAYDTLTPARQKLLSRIACFRSAVSYEALLAIASAPESSKRKAKQKQAQPLEQSLDADLHDLLARSLLHRDEKTNRFDLHPIVRRYAYDRLTASDRTAAHTQLRDYFASVPAPDKVQTLDDLQPVIELYHHTVRAGQYDEAYRLFKDRIDTPTYYQFGAYQLQIELLRALFPDGEDRLPRLNKESDHALALNDLAAVYGLSGQPRRAVPLLERDISILERLKLKNTLPAPLSNVASQQMIIGTLRAAEANLRRSIDLDRELDDEFHQAVEHQGLGRLLAYRGAWAESEQELNASQQYDERENEIQGLCIDYTYRALCALLIARHSPSRVLGGGVGGEGGARLGAEVRGEALSTARRALELAEERHRSIGRPNVRDYIRAHWLLGAAHRLNGDLALAEYHLSEALTRCRNINMVDHEAYILLDLARLRVDQGEREEASRLAQEALLITERSEYVLQGADVHLFLAQEALKDNDKAQALQHAREARRLATCDGPPDYTYKVAYDEAGALLEQLGKK